MMDCEKIQDGMMAVLAGGTPEVSVEKIRNHLESCDRCEIAMGEIAENWVTMNRALMPEPTEEFWKEIEPYILAIPKMQRKGGSP